MDAARLMRARNAASIPDSLGAFVVVPGGKGVVGSDSRVRTWDGTEYDEYPANGPPRSVTFPRAFLMGRGVVTVAAFRAMCPEMCRSGAPVFVLPESGSVDDPWPTRPFSEVNSHDDHPVVGVTWPEAVRFCDCMRRQHRLRARLPTEDEWEYAARAQAHTVYAWGDDPRGCPAFAWTKQNSAMMVHPTERLAPNPWGLHDMAGNVWEWCADEFHGPRDGGVVRRSIRGGASFNDPTAVRASHRWGQAPEQRNAFLGFRVLIELHDSAGW